MITATRRIEFDAAHRVMNHEGKCASLHGHRYVVEIEARADALDSLGRIIDFSVLKSLVGGWIDLNWDHTSLIFREDTEVCRVLSGLPGPKKPYIVPFNPTAENMANHLLREVCPALLGGNGIEVVAVIVWETPNCKAVARL